MDVKQGQVRVGRIVDKKNPVYDNFTNIIVMMRSHSKWYPLFSYFLKTEEGYIHENVWQFSKIF